VAADLADRFVQAPYGIGDLLHAFLPAQVSGNLQAVADPEQVPDNLIQQFLVAVAVVRGGGPGQVG